MRFNEIINLFLWKQLPYDIKCLLYSAVAGYHKRKMTTGYCDVIKTIKNINNTGNNVDNCNNSLNLLDVDTFMQYNENRLYSLNYFYILKFEKELNIYKSWSLQRVAHVIYDCEKIKEQYGRSLYVYFLNKNNDLNSLSYENTLLYGNTNTYLRNISPRYNKIMITDLLIIDLFIKRNNIDISIIDKDEIIKIMFKDKKYVSSLNQKGLQDVIKNSIFLIDLNELLSNFFSFKKENLFYQSIYKV